MCVLVSPVVSVVVPVFNGSRTLAKCLSAICSSDLPNIELIVVDDGSSHGSAEIASRFTSKVICHPFNRGRSAARASGHREARGEIIVCIDCDILVEPSSLRRIVDRFVRDPGCMVLSGRLADRQPELNLPGQYLNLRLSYLYRNLPKRIPFFYGGVFAFRSELKHHFNSDFEICEDTDIGMRLFRGGTPIYLDQTIMVQHLKSLSLGEFFAGDFRMAMNWARIFIRNRAWGYMLLSQPTQSQVLRYLFPLGLIMFACQVRGIRFAPVVMPMALAQALILPCGFMIELARLALGGSREPVVRSELMPSPEAVQRPPYPIQKEVA